MPNQEQFYNDFRAVNDFYTSQDGLQRPGGMVIGGVCDVEAMGQWGWQLSQGVALASVLAQIRTSDEWKTKHAHDPHPPFPQAPSRTDLLNGRTTQQGLTITTTQFGQMPWWGSCWAWLSPQARQEAATQLLAAGDTICLIQLPDGIPLYDEANQFYTADKFGPLDMTSGNLQIDASFRALIEEALLLGFKGVWVFLGGDDGEHGYPIAIKQTQMLGPLLATSQYGDLNQYVVQFPGWDGVFYGYTPEHVGSFAAAARTAGAAYVGLEHSTAHLPVGNGTADYEPGGLMTNYDVILGEFDFERYDDTVWQVLGRMIQPYNRPPEQPAGDDPHPPFYLAPVSDRGPYIYRVFEYGIYQWVRGVPEARIRAARETFESMGARNVC